MKDKKPTTEDFIKMQVILNSNRLPDTDRHIWFAGATYHTDKYGNIIDVVPDGQQKRGEYGK